VNYYNCNTRETTAKGALKMERGKVLKLKKNRELFDPKTSADKLPEEILWGF